MKITSGKIKWIDIIGPTKKDIDFLKSEYAFHPIILDELMQLSARSRVEIYDNYLYMTYHLPVYDPSQKTSRRTEIDFLITKDAVITVHYENLEPLEEFEGLLNSSREIQERALEENTAMLTYYMLQALIGFSLRELHHIGNNVHEISKIIFKGRESALLEQISYVKHDILDYHIISRPQSILLNSLKRAAGEFWSGKFDIYFNDLLGDNEKVQLQIENYREITESLEETNSQRLNTKINSSMQIFTTLAFFTFPLVLFTEIYSVQNRNEEFWIGFSIVALTTIILPLIFLKKRKF